MTQSPPKTAEEIAREYLTWQESDVHHHYSRMMELTKLIAEAEARGRAESSSVLNFCECVLSNGETCAVCTRLSKLIADAVELDRADRKGNKISDDELEKLAHEWCDRVEPGSRWRNAVDNSDEQVFMAGYRAAERNYEQALITKTPDCVTTWPSENEVAAACFDYTTEFGGDSNDRLTFQAGVEWLKARMGC